MHGRSLSLTAPFKVKPDDVCDTTSWAANLIACCKCTDQHVGRELLGVHLVTLIIVLRFVDLRFSKAPHQGCCTCRP